MLHTTFRIAHRMGACVGSYEKLARHLGSVNRYGKDTSIPLSMVMEVLGLNDALWCLTAVLPEEKGERDKLARLLACDYAEHVSHLWVAPPGITWKPSDTIAVARRYALGQATPSELKSARAAAWAARAAARAAAEAAREAAWVAAEAAAGAAAWAAAWVAAGAAREAAWVAAWAAWVAWAAERKWQAEKFMELLTSPSMPIFPLENRLAEGIRPPLVV